MPVTALSLYAMQSGLSMRPQVVSYLLTAVVVAAWLRTLDGRRPATRALVAGPPGLAVGDAPRDVAGRAHDRRRSPTVGLALDRAPRGVVLRSGAVTVACAVGGGA